MLLLCIISTIHTLDAIGTLIRLLDMGIEPYLVSSSVTGIIAQRLIRKICTDCQGRNKECQHCLGNGFRGRMGIYEVLRVEEELHPYILNRCSADMMRGYVKSGGFTPLYSVLQQKVAAGVAESDEFQRYVWYADKTTVV